MTRSDRWTDRVLAFLAGVVLTTVIGAWAVPAVHAGVQRAVAETTALEKPTLSTSLQRARSACRAAWEAMEGVQVPRYSEVGP